MLFGTEQSHSELRVRTIVELAKYSFFYLAEGEVITRMEAEMAILNAKAVPNCWVILSSSLSKNIVNNRLKIESLSLQHDDFNGEADRSFLSYKLMLTFKLLVKKALSIG